MNKGTILCNLNNNNYTLESFKYSRVNKKNYKIAKVKNYIDKFFDEKNNMESVIKNFYFGKKNIFNFELTKNINKFLILTKDKY